MPTRRYGRRTVETSNADKLFFPDEGITKGDVVDYYDEIAEHMLPFLRHRPLSLQRFPDGLRRKGFFQKRKPRHFPDWIDSVTVQSEQGSLEQVVCSDRATLVYLADQACLTPHPWLSRTDRIDQPDQMIFDLDPSGDDFEPVRRAAFRLRDLLDEIGFVPYVRTTGSKGLHVVVPLRRGSGFDEVREFAGRVAELMARRHPDELTNELRKRSRRGRVFVDWLRNAYGQTAVASYSLRALPGAPVATPVDWDELRRRRLQPQSYTLRNVRRRVRQRDDPWVDFARRGRPIGNARAALDELLAEQRG